MYYKLLNTETNEILTMSLVDILENVNSDRSDGWTPYDETDWLDGLNNFTEFKFVEEVLNENK